jgi:hypothetical protein
VSLAAVTDDGDGFPFKDVKIGVVIVIHLHHDSVLLYSQPWNDGFSQAALPKKVIIPWMEFLQAAGAVPLRAEETDTWLCCVPRAIAPGHRVPLPEFHTLHI